MEIELDNDIFRNNFNYSNDDEKNRVLDEKKKKGQLKDKEIKANIGNLPYPEQEYLINDQINIDKEKTQIKQVELVPIPVQVQPSQADQEYKFIKIEKQEKQIKKELEDKIKSSEFNINFEKVFSDKLKEEEYNVTYYGILNSKTEDIEEFENSAIVSDYIEKNLKIKENKVDIIEYQSPADILLDGQLENGAIEINIKYKDISLLNETISLDDYKNGARVKDIKDFIEDFKKQMKNNYISFLSHIFETMEFNK